MDVNEAILSRKHYSCLHFTVQFELLLLDEIGERVTVQLDGSLVGLCLFELFHAKRLLAEYAVLVWALTQGGEAPIVTLESTFKL